MALEDRSILGEVRSESVPSRSTAGTQARCRVSNYGEQLVTMAGKAGTYAMANEGSYFVATNATPGTAIAGIAAADGFDDTEALLYLRNNATASEGTRLYLDYILLRCTVVGTNGTNFAYAMTTDTGSAKYASGGTAITPVNVNRASSATADATMYFGAVVPTTSTTDRLVSHKLLRTVIKVVGDTYLFDFGAERKDTTNMATAGTAICHQRIPCPPIVLGPTDMFCLHEFAASQSVAAQYEFEMGFWQR